MTVSINNEIKQDVRLGLSRAVLDDTGSIVITAGAGTDDCVTIILDEPAANAVIRLVARAINATNHILPF